MNIFPIKAFSDNYIWIIGEQEKAIVVDPGESMGVVAYLEENQLEEVAILLTHKHEDHVGGVKEIVTQYPKTVVYGPEETENFADRVAKDGDTFELYDKTFKVYKTAGHTEEHISYLMDDALFCGDALFSGGCGRVFTGDYQAQYDALQKFKQLENQVKVYAGHEYTQTNLRFAQTIEPRNKVIGEVLEEVNELLKKGEPTLPSTIGKEKEINLFMRAETLEDFIELREARDDF